MGIALASQKVHERLRATLGVALQAGGHEIPIGIVTALGDGLKVVKGRGESGEEFPAVMAEEFVPFEDLLAILPNIVEVDFAFWVDLG